MFDEISTQSAEYHAPLVARGEGNHLREAVAQVMMIEQQTNEPDEKVAAHFAGRLMVDSATAFAQLDTLLAPMDCYAFFSEEEGQHHIVVMRERYQEQPRSWYLNAVLLVLTIFSTMFAGAVIDSDVETLQELVTKGGIFKGIPYMLAVMLILGAHELGHYFAARYHKVSVTLPYFIPFPFGFFGTLGAFIQLREPMQNRNQLFDIGVSGPLAGLAFALPILLIGVATAEVNALPTDADCREEGICSYLLEGNSLAYATAKYIIHGKWLPNDLEDMNINQLSFAGWTGLFVTGLNLLPVGQLDGGHILYTLVGKRARQLYLPAVGLMVVLALNNSGWILWVFLLLMFGRVYAIPLDDITPLDGRRRVIGVLALLIFVLVFIPSPFTVVNLSSG